jgi:hypothetical protein
MDKLFTDKVKIDFDPDRVNLFLVSIVKLTEAELSARNTAGGRAGNVIFDIQNDFNIQF